MSNSPLISIIMPAYNAEKTIEKSINSVLSQTYKNIELIVVNDGSVDRTESIVQKIIDVDDRIKLISIPNGGVSHARNIGIDNARGEYIGFIDSDDTIDEDMYEILIELIKKHDVQIAHCSYKNVSEDGHIISVVGDGSKEILLNHDDALEYYLSGKLFTGGLWNKLYHHSLFEQVRLEEDIKFNEDVLANFHLFNCARSSVYINKPCYNYIANASSVTHSAAGIKSSEDILKVNELILKFSADKPYENIAELRYLYSLLGMYRAYIFTNMHNSKQAKETLDKIFIYKNQGVYTSMKDILTIYIYKFFPSLFKLLYKIYDKIRIKRLDPEQ